VYFDHTSAMPLPLHSGADSIISTGCRIDLLYGISSYYRTAANRSKKSLQGFSAHRQHAISASASERRVKQEARLSLGKARYSLYSSCCSTDVEGHPRSMIFISSERAYAISY